MRSKFNVKSCFFALIVLSIAILRNFVRCDGQNLQVQPNPIQNSFEINSPQEFTDKVLMSKDAVITQFHAPWCAPCKVLSPLLQKSVDEQKGKIKLARMSIERPGLDEVAKAQGVRSIPTVASYKDGKRVDTMLGFRTEKDVQNFVEKQVE